MRTILAMLLLCVFSVGTAEAHRHHHRYHRHVVVRAHSFAEGLGHGLAHMLGSITTAQTEAGPIRVAAAYAERFVGFINALVHEGYKPHEIGCYSPTGHMPHSKHHWGGACDIDQRSRNRTAAFMYHITAIAHKFNLTDGCEWRNPDCGHVEIPGAVTRRFYAHHLHHFHHARIG